MACLKKECLDSDEYCSVTSGINRSLADSMTSVARDKNEIDLCAVCYSSKGSITYATHFCEECGILGRFLCETCLIYHNQFTKHTGVKSFLAAKHKLSAKTIDTTKENDTDKMMYDSVILTKAQRQLTKHFDKETERRKELNTVVGAAIMDDNPYIFEFSDVNGPTKLSEIFSELYDNEWTDVFEGAENEFKTEEKRIAYLYKTLLDVFDFCEQKSVEHENSIRTCVMTLPDSSNRGSKLPEIGYTNQRKLKEIRKSFAPMLVESVFQSYLKEKKLNLTRKEITKNFVRKGVAICWLMNSQDPPVIIDSTVVTGKPFDADKYKPYTKTGKVVDYVVWPPILLHKDGPVLCKGVAQGK